MPTPAHARLAALFPDVGPWTSAALWHGLVELPTPGTPIERELSTLVAGRLAELARSYCRSRPDQAGVSPAALAALQRTSFRWTAGTVATTQATRSALDVLAAVGVEGVVTKGPGIAAHYPDATWRPYSDLDLLVARADFAPALAALRRHGWGEESKNRQPHEYFARFCREGTNLHEGDFGSIDLHHAVPPWLWGRGLDLAGIAPRARTVTVGGSALRCASPEDNALVAALHVVSDRNQPGMSLLVWRDVLQLVAASDPAVLAARARETGLEGWLRAVLSAVPRAVRPEGFIALLRSREVDHPVRLSALLARGWRAWVSARPSRCGCPCSTARCSPPGWRCRRGGSCRRSSPVSPTRTSPGGTAGGGRRISSRPRRPVRGRSAARTTRRPASTARRCD